MSVDPIPLNVVTVVLMATVMVYVVQSYNTVNALQLSKISLQ